LINGQRGVFLLDTGASYVTLKQSFARRAGITVDAGRVVRLKTANGVTSAQRGVADSIQIRDARARDVSVVVQPDSQAAYGDRVDGLLGMSFLARFNVSIDGARVTLRPRALPSE
jgi:aspartyl protease family protein